MDAKHFKNIRYTLYAVCGHFISSCKFTGQHGPINAKDMSPIPRENIYK